MPSYDFDRPIDRRGTSATKWHKYADRDVLPFWVADMEFAAPPFVLDAVRARLDHGVLGYTDVPESLVEAFIGWAAQRYDWVIEPEWLVWLSGVVPGLNLTARAVAETGGEVLIPTPVYYPFLNVPQHAGQRAVAVPMVRGGGAAATSRWEMDFDALTAAVNARSRLLLLCNPQNPTGRVYDRSELATLVDFCNRHDVTLCSDEIHCPLVLSGEHVPIAALDTELAQRCVTLHAPNKAYNLPGLGCAVAVIPNAQLRGRFRRARAGLVGNPGPLAYAAAEAAYRDESSWLEALLTYLRGNRDAVAEVAGARMSPVEATYLAWIDLTAIRRWRDMPAPISRAYGLGLSDGDGLRRAGIRAVQLRRTPHAARAGPRPPGRRLA